MSGKQRIVVSINELLKDDMGYFFVMLAFGALYEAKDELEEVISQNPELKETYNKFNETIVPLIKIIQKQ